MSLLHSIAISALLVFHAGEAYAQNAPADDLAPASERIPFSERIRSAASCEELRAVHDDLNLLREEVERYRHDLNYAEWCYRSGENLDVTLLKSGIVLGFTGISAYLASRGLRAVLSPNGRLVLSFTGQGLAMAGYLATAYSFPVHHVMSYFPIQIAKTKEKILRVEERIGRIESEIKEKSAQFRGCTL